MTKERALWLLQNIVELMGAGNTLEGQIGALVGYGFTRSDLLFFGFSEEALDECEVD